MPGRWYPCSLLNALLRQTTTTTTTTIISPLPSPRGGVGIVSGGRVSVVFRLTNSQSRKPLTVPAVLHVQDTWRIQLKAGI